MDFPFLKKTSIWNALSPLGKQMYTPKGIFYWSKRAAEEAEVNATIGIAQDDDATISHLKVAEEWAGRKIMERVPRAKVFGYAPIVGLASLRKKWLAQRLKNNLSLERYATLPVVTNGITHSLAVASRMLLEKGQTFLTADKSWENYEHIFSDVQGIKISTFPLFTSTGAFSTDSIIHSCKEIVQTQGKVVLLLNFPHNQTGYMPSDAICETLGDQLQELCEQFPNIPFVVVLDDAYEGYVYDSDGKKSSPVDRIFRNVPNLTAIKLDGVSKELLAYGYRVGFITFFLNPLASQQFSVEELRAIREETDSKIGGFIRGEISQVNHHGQILADALLENAELVAEQRSEVISRLRERWECLMNELEQGYETHGKEKFWADPCNGGFFCYLNLEKNIDPKQIAERLLREKKVGVIPSEQGLRLTFASVPKEKIPRLVQAIFEVVYG